MRRRVVITGIGCVSPVGNCAATSWQSVYHGKSGVGQISHFDASGFPTRIAAEVKDFNLSDWVGSELLGSCDRVGRHIKYGGAAACQAIQDSGLDYRRIDDPTRLGVYLGSGQGTQDFLLLMQLIMASINGPQQIDLRRFNDLSLPLIDAKTEYNKEPNVLSALIAGMFGAQGPNLNSLTACAASAQAVGEATEIIRRGDADIMIAGGAHTMIDPFSMTGFSLLQVLSLRNNDPTAASRPFDRGRDGFVMGEGAAILILEEFDSARRRGARIYGEVLGYGVACDAYRLTDVPPTGTGLARSIEKSLRDAGLNANDIDYVNAHGTSTSTNDRAETQAMKQAFGPHVQRVPISGTKSTTGHLVAACGAFEAMISLLALRDGIVPPTINYEEADPECDLDYIPNVARDRKLKTVMSNNSGFGGQNVSLIFASV